MQAAVNRAIVKLRSGQLGAEGSSPAARAMSGPMQEVQSTTLLQQWSTLQSMLWSTRHAQMAMQGVLERARQLNACVAYGGVSPTALMEDEHMRVLLSLLPSTARTNGTTKQLSIGMHINRRTVQQAHHLLCETCISCLFSSTSICTEETCNYVTILQCLQRVTSSPHITASLLATPGWASTVTAALQSGSEAVSMEAARLLTRLWAPTMPRTGATPPHAVFCVVLQHEA